MKYIQKILASSVFLYNNGQYVTINFSSKSFGGMQRKVQCKGPSYNCFLFDYDMYSEHGQSCMKDSILIKLTELLTGSFRQQFPFPLTN